MKITTIHDALARYQRRCSSIKWHEVKLDDERLIDATIGEIAIDIYPDRAPVHWIVRVLIFEGYDDEPIIKGDAVSVVEAKAAAAKAAQDIVPAMLDYMLNGKKL